MSDIEKKGPDDASRKKLKTSEDVNTEAPHSLSEGAPKISELVESTNGNTETETRTENEDSKMAVDEPSKPKTAQSNSSDAPSGEEEEKQDLKSIEDEFTQLKEKFFADKIAAVKAEIDQVEQGTHEGIIAETKAAEAKKLRKIQLAQQIHKLQTQSIDLALAADLKCSEDEFVAEIKDLKEKTLKALNKKKKDLEEEKKDFSLSDNPTSADQQRVSTRTLRKRGQGKDALDSTTNPTAVAPSGEVLKKVPEVKVRLTDEEMDYDMSQIQKGLLNL